ncbi:MAG: hypothetical protein AAB606_04540 [Patescibacteria group bacterium]
MKTFFRVLQIGGVVVFCASAIFAILFAEGYQYDPATRDVIKKSVIYFDSLPEDVEVSVDSRNINIGASREIRTAPGAHDIEITKDGFNPWKKRVVVPEDFVVRFPELKIMPIVESGTSPQFIKDIEPLAGWSMQSSSEEGVFMSNPKLHFGKYYLFSADDDFRVIELPLKFEFEKVMPFGNNSLVGLTRDNRIFAYDSENQKLVSRKEKDFIDLRVMGGELFVLDKIGNIWTAGQELELADFSKFHLFATLAQAPTAIERTQRSENLISFLFKTRNKKSLVVTRDDGSIIFQKGNLDSAFLDKQRVFVVADGILEVYDIEKKKELSKRTISKEIVWLSRVGETYQFLFTDSTGEISICDEDFENCNAVAAAAKLAGNYFIESSQDHDKFIVVIGRTLKLLDLGENSFLPPFLQNLMSSVFSKKI